MIHIIINPNAGKGYSEKSKSKLTSILDKQNEEYTIHYSQGPKHIISLVKELKDKTDRIFIVGGDGSIQEAIEGLIKGNVNSPLGIIPSGSGNDLVKTLGISDKLEEAITNALSHQTKEIRLGRVNEQIFANVISTGVDSSIVARKNKLRKYLSGSFSYLVSTIVEILIYEPQCYRIQTDQVTFEDYYYLIAVGNGKYYGGGMCVTPLADPTSELFQVVLVKKMSRLKLLFLFPLIYSGKHIAHKDVLTIMSTKVIIDCFGRKQSVNYDGELTFASTIEVKKAKEVVRIIYHE